MGMFEKIKNRIKWVLSYPVDWLLCIIYSKPVVNPIEESLNMILQTSASISRFGDGEFDIIMGKDIPFQKYEESLADKLRKILLIDHEDFFVGIPDYFTTLSIYNDHAKRYYKNYLRTHRRYIYRLLKKNKIYYAAGITRPYIDLSDKSCSNHYFILLKRIWNGKKIVIVEGDKSRLGVGNDLFSGCLEIKRVLCPSTNAFSCYSEILETIKKFDKNYMILLALGPTATAMAYDLYLEGYRALDIGHVDIEYEWYLMGAMEKVPVNNKYTNEAESTGGLNVGDCIDEVYQSQIVERIGC